MNLSCNFLISWDCYMKMMNKDEEDEDEEEKIVVKMIKRKNLVVTIHRRLQ
jgi:hypothetical protein